MLVYSSHHIVELLIGWSVSKFVELSTSTDYVINYNDTFTHGQNQELVFLSELKGGYVDSLQLCALDTFKAGYSITFSDSSS